MREARTGLLAACCWVFLAVGNLSLLHLAPANNVFGEDWPGWRGPRGDGGSDEPKLPLHWNGETGEHIAWRRELPGVGHSSPIVSGDLVFVCTCDIEDGRRLLLALDRRSGELRWEREVLRAPLEKKHNLNSFASGTPCADEQSVYVAFLQPDFGSTKERTPGDMVVACYDREGNERWLARPGRFASVHGFCSSPVLYEDLVIVNGDHDGDSYIVALRRADGAEVWRVPREHKTRSYVTPLIRHLAGKEQLLFSGSKSVVSLEPRTGREHWRIDGPTEQFVASMVDNGKLVFLTAGFPEHHILAIRPDGEGNVTDSHIVWRTTKHCSYVPSPVVSGDYFLVASDAGIGSCYEADTGNNLWSERLGKHYSASLLVSRSNGLVYFMADEGVTKIVRPGPTLEVVAENPLGENVYASPAASEGQLFVRGEKHLFCIE